MALRRPETMKTRFPEESFLCSLIYPRIMNRSAICLFAYRQAGMGSLSIERRADSIFQRERLSGGHPDSGRRTGRTVARRAIDLMNPDHPGASSITNSTRTNRKTRRKYSFTRWARGASNPAFTTFFGIRPSQSRHRNSWTARRGSGTTSCSASVTAGGRVASGLFLLDAHDSAGASDLLDRA